MSLRFIYPAFASLIIFQLACGDEPSPPQTQPDAAIADATPTPPPPPPPDAGDAQPDVGPDDLGVPDSGEIVPGEPAVALDTTRVELLYVIGSATPPTHTLRVQHQGTLETTINYEGPALGDWLETQPGSAGANETPYTLALARTDLIEGVYAATVIFTARGLDMNGAPASASASLEVILVAVPSATPPTIPPFVPDKVMHGADQLLYLYVASRAEVHRWSLRAERYLTPIALGSTATHVAYASTNHQLYVGHNMGAIRQIDLLAGVMETSFASLPLAPHGLETAGPIVFAADASGAWGTHYTFLANGTPASTIEWNYDSPEYAWSTALGRMFFFRDGSPADLHYETINTANGLITGEGESPYHGDFAIRLPIRPSVDGRFVLLGSGDLYDGTSLEVVGSIPIEPADAAWLSDGTLLTIRTERGATLLEQWAQNNTLFERVNFQSYAGAPIRILPNGTVALVITNSGGMDYSIYIPTDDGDADGVPYGQDAFPLDPAASIDTDGDGYPDSWNPGYTQADSTTGLVLDAFPFDSACQLPSHALPNDPTQCDISRAVPNYVPDRVFLGANDVVYLFSSAHARIFRWSLATDWHLNPIVLAAADASDIAYSEVDDRLYVSYDSGAINAIDPATLTETAFATLPSAPRGLSTAGSIVFAADASGAWATHYTFHSNGTPVSVVDWNYISEEYIFSAALSRMFFFRDHSPSDLHYEVIDAASGSITGEGESPYHGDYLITPPIRPSANGEYVLLGSGNLYDGTSLEVVGSLPIEPADAAWLGDGTLLTIRADGTGTLLEQWAEIDELFQIVNFEQFSGTPIRVFPTAGGAVLITKLGATLVYTDYLPTDDGDGDGVPFAGDAFPLDPAASIDTDGDGYPDSWNAGYTQADSTTGLVLDAFPLDSACQLPSHAMPNDPTTCDVIHGIPFYVPDQVIAAGDMVYLFSRAHARIFGWSLSSNYHVNPLVLAGSEPRFVAYSETDDLLYVAYRSGAISKIDPSTGAESTFATLPAEPRGLATAGSIVFSVDDSGAWATHYTFLPNGAQISAVEWNYISGEYAWSPGTGRMYFFRDNTSPNDLHWEEINTTSGLITAEGETPYHGDYAILPPIRPSPSGNLVLIGSGDLYDGTALTIAGSIPVEPNDAAWLPDGTLLTIRSFAGGTLLEQWVQQGPGFILVNFHQFTGAPVRILPTASGATIITDTGTRPVFTDYVPTDDGDGDGVPFADDAFPLDPAASLDTDGDGYPDSWNAGYTQADSTTGLEVDAFPLDSACQLPQHALASDPTQCDIANGIPAYTPDQVVFGADDVIYLFSRTHRKIFRWSLAVDYHLNPIVLDAADPRYFAYSEVNQSLYVADISGAITRIELNTLDEVPFASLPGEPRGLATAGAIVFAADPSGAWATHYTFLADGTPVSAVDWNRLSNEYVWSPAIGRMYFFRNGTSPNDLHWEAINTTTGEITAEGESPYHGQYSIVGPIRPSLTGAHVLLGAGNIYDGTTLSVVFTLPTAVLDAAWLSDGSFVTVRHSAGSTIVEHRSSTFSLLSTQTLSGVPIRIFAGAAEIVLMTQGLAGPAFQTVVL